MAIVKYKNFAYLKGPAGDRGPKGDRGDRGPKGDQGPIGLTGAPGVVNNNEIRALFSGTGAITYNSTSGVIGFNSIGLATESYVNNAISSIIDGAPDLLNTLNEIAQALGDDPNIISSVLAQLNQKLNLTGGVLTGNLILNGAPTFTLQAATKGYVDVSIANAIAGYDAYDQSLNTTDDVTFNSITAKNIDVESLEFTGTGPIVIASGNDLSFNAVGDIKFNGIKLSDIQVDGGSF
jgi:hypothetical protein